MSDAFRHLGARRSCTRLIPRDDEPAGALLSDILDANLDPRAERAALREWVHRAVRYAKLRRTRKSNQGAIHVRSLKRANVRRHTPTLHVIT